MSILIGADIVPTESNKFSFDFGNKQNVVDVELLNLLSNSGYRIFNFEWYFVNNHLPIQKEVLI